MNGKLIIFFKRIRRLRVCDPKLIGKFTTGCDTVCFVFVLFVCLICVGRGYMNILCLAMTKSCVP